MSDGAAAPHRAARVLAQTAFEARAILRNGEQLLVTIVVPVLVLIGLTKATGIDIDTDGMSRIDFFTPGVLALAIMTSSFTSQAIASAFDRRNGVLRLLSTTPLGRGGLLAGKILGVLAVEVVQVVVIATTALLLGWHPDPTGLLLAVVAVVLGTAAFTSLALLVAGTLRAEAVLAVANLLLLLLAVAGGVIVPADRLPGPDGAHRAPAAVRGARRGDARDPLARRAARLVGRRARRLDRRPRLGCVAAVPLALTCDQPRGPAGRGHPRPDRTLVAVSTVPRRRGPTAAVRAAARPVGLAGGRGQPGRPDRHHRDRRRRAAHQLRARLLELARSASPASSPRSCTRSRRSTRTSSSATGWSRPSSSSSAWSSRCSSSASGAGLRRTARSGSSRWLGVVVQAVIGGLSVIYDLNPAIVGSHLLISMAPRGVLGLAGRAHARGRPTCRPARRRHPAHPHARAHGPDRRGPRARRRGHGRRTALGRLEVGYRFDVDPWLMAKVHAASVWAFVAVLVAILVLLRRSGVRGRPWTAALVLLGSHPRAGADRLRAAVHRPADRAGQPAHAGRRAAHHRRSRSSSGRPARRGPAARSSTQRPRERHRAAIGQIAFRVSQGPHSLDGWTQQSPPVASSRRTAASSRSTASTSRSPEGPCSVCSARTGPARPPSSGCSAPS